MRYFDKIIKYISIPTFLSFVPLKIDETCNFNALTMKNNKAEMKIILSSDKKSYIFSRCYDLQLKRSILENDVLSILRFIDNYAPENIRDLVGEKIFNCTNYDCVTYTEIINHILNYQLLHLTDVLFYVSKLLDSKTEKELLEFYDLHIKWIKTKSTYIYDKILIVYIDKIVNIVKSKSEEELFDFVSKLNHDVINTIFNYHQDLIPNESTKKIFEYYCEKNYKQKQTTNFMIQQISMK
jgi:hypothetical protein